MSDRQNEIVGLLIKLNDKIDDIKEHISEIESRLSSLETWKEGQAAKDSHFWTVTWPSQAEVIKSVEARVRVVERERISSIRIEAMEAALCNVQVLNTLLPRMEKVEGLTEEFTKLAVKMKLMFAVVAFIGGLMGSLALQMFQ